MAEEDRAAIQLAAALLDESRRRFEASEKRFDDLRSRARGLATAVAALLVLDVNLVSSLSDPAKNAPTASIILALIGTGMHLLLLSVAVRAGYVFEPGKGLPDARKAVGLAADHGHIETIRELGNHYANAAADLEKRYAAGTDPITNLTDRIVASLILPVFAVSFFAAQSLNR